jgi:hypothetical protein
MAWLKRARPVLDGMPAALRSVPIPAHLSSPPAPGWPALWWVGCHGGAGTTTLARLTGLGAELGTAGWPRVGADAPVQPVVLVARGSASGTWAAMGAVEQSRARTVPGVRVLGIVVVAASPRRPPKVAADRVQLLAGWVPQVWRVGWHDALLAAEDAASVGMPPDVDKLRSALDDALARDQMGAR